MRLKLFIFTDYRLAVDCFGLAPFTVLCIRGNSNAINAVDTSAIFKVVHMVHIIIGVAGTTCVDCDPIIWAYCSPLQAMTYFSTVA